MAQVPIYQRQSVAFTGNIPRVTTDISGLTRGIDQVGQALTTYQKRVDKLTLMTLNNDLHTKRLEELTDTRLNVRKQSAADLTQRETNRITQEKSVFINNAPEHLKNEATLIYNNASQQYLSQIAGHEIGQINAWERDQVANTGATYSKMAVNTQTGNVDALHNLIKEMTAVLSDHPQAAEVIAREMTVSTFQTWANISPEVTEKALHENAGKLKTIMGDDYNKVLTAVRQGSQFAKAEKEYNYQLGQRIKSDREEATLKQGLSLWTDPEQQLTPDFILNNSSNLSASGMNTLRALLDSQNAGPKVDATNTDYTYLYQLSKMVRNRKQLGLHPDFVADLVVKAINTSIPPKTGESFLKIITADSQLTVKQRETQNLINNLVFDKKKNRDVVARSTLQAEFDRGLAAGGANYDSSDLNERISQEHKKGVDRKYAEMLDPFYRSRPGQVGEIGAAYMTDEERGIIDKGLEQFTKRYPNFTGDILEVEAAMLNQVRQSYISGGLR